MKASSCEAIYTKGAVVRGKQQEKVMLVMMMSALRLKKSSDGFYGIDDKIAHTDAHARTK